MTGGASEADLILELLAGGRIEIARRSGKAYRQCVVVTGKISIIVDGGGTIFSDRTNVGIINGSGAGYKAEPLQKFLIPKEWWLAGQPKPWLLQGHEPIIRHRQRRCALGCMMKPVSFLIAPVLF